MQIEHLALNVAHPVAMAQWYVEHLGMTIVRDGPPPVSVRFLADSGGRVMLEVYRNPPDAVPDYAAIDPLLLHIAFVADDVDTARDRLIAAGAIPVGDIEVTPAGDRLVMLRDPWGLAIQLAKRVDPMVPRE